MDFKNKSNSWQALWVAAGSFSSFTLGIISAAVLSRILEKEDYGTYKQIIYVYSMLLVVFSAGLPRIFSYFLPRYSIEQGKAIVNKVTKLLLIIGFVFSLFLYFGSDMISIALNNSKLSRGLKLFSPIPLLLLPTLGIEGIFSTYKKNIFIAIYNTITRLLVLSGILIAVLIFEQSFEFAIYGWLVGSFFSLIIALYFKNIPFKGIRTQKTILSFKEMLSYSLPLMYASIWGIIIKAADQFYISRYFGEEVFAEYTNGFIQIPLVSMVTASTSVVLMPLFSRIFNENDDPTRELLPLWRNAITKSSMLIYPIVIFFIVFSNEIMVLLYSEKYTESSTYFSISVVVNFFNIIIFAPLFLASGNTKIYAKAHMCLAIIVWISGYFVVDLIGDPYYLAINSVFWESIKSIAFVFIASKLLKIKVIDFFPLKNIGKVLSLSIITIIPSYYLVTIIQNVLIINKILELILVFIFYALFFVIGSKIFNLNYYNLIIPFLKKKL